MKRAMLVCVALCVLHMLTLRCLFVSPLTTSLSAPVETQRKASLGLKFKDYAIALGAIVAIFFVLKILELAKSPVCAARV